MKKIIISFLYIFWILATRPDGEHIWINNEAIIAVTRHPIENGYTCCTLIKTYSGDIRVLEMPEEIMYQLNVKDGRYEK